MEQNSNRLLLVGCNGLLGQKLAAAASQSYHVYGIGLREQSPVRKFLRQYIRLDITDRGDIMEVMRSIHPEWTINVAAITDVDACQRDPERAFAVNVEGARHVALGCERCGSKFLQLSTDYVFDGTSGPYDEDHVPNPVNVYGRTKVASEQLLKRLELEYTIIRTVLVYGSVSGARADFVQWVRAALDRGESVRGAADLYGNPTLVDDLAQGIMVTVRKGARGVYHMAGGDWLSRYDFAMNIARTFDLNGDLIQPVSFHELGLNAPRPLQAGLRTKKVRQEFELSFASAQEGLKRVRAQMRSGENT